MTSLSEPDNFVRFAKHSRIIAGYSKKHSKHSAIFCAGCRPRTTRSFCFGKRTQNHSRPGVALRVPVPRSRWCGLRNSLRSDSPRPHIEKRDRGAAPPAGAGKWRHQMARLFCLGLSFPTLVPDLIRDPDNLLESSVFRLARGIRKDGRTHRSAPTGRRTTTGGCPYRIVIVGAGPCAPLTKGEKYG